MDRALGGGGSYTSQSVISKMQAILDQSGVPMDPTIAINGQRMLDQIGPDRAPPVSVVIDFFRNVPPIELRGGNVGRGLGWIILLLGLAVALHPYLITTRLDGETLQRAALVALGIGAIILMYLLSQSFRYAVVGLFIVIIGYALEIAGQAMEGRQA